MSADGPDAAVIVASVVRPGVFSVVYERHLSRVTAYLARRVGGELAEDLAAEVFVRAFRARRSYRPLHDTALPWLMGIANHVVADHRRAERRRLVALQRLPIPPDRIHASDPAVLPPALVRTLRRLAVGDRDALLLVVWGELTYEETATALEIPVGTVRSRIARARRRLASALANESPDRTRSSTDTPCEETHA